ncbi:hypothetical protein QBC34DRAFT_412722 [Podospora aff. communis PSN243]|uniref:Uncharacterized protein n=1 Tax=Podospora aff. communis PSN243 TaxID=3040156 RepID=A0AAV9GF96_9PEZI|nr:hypothetical protein QBC34DRAFT_412722 [Podospora aff. communis PSN243]
MQPAKSAAIRAVWEKVHSPKGFPFPSTIAALVELGVTRYRADYTAGTVTAYVDSTGETDVAPLSAKHDGTAGKQWSLAGLQKAIQNAQAGLGNYHDFSAAAVDAGVADYTTYITGKKVVYNGVLGESHTEWFPGARKD